jgi:hypothetical protein
VLGADLEAEDEKGVDFRRFEELVVTGSATYEIAAEKRHLESGSRLVNSEASSTRHRGLDSGEKSLVVL